MEGYVYMYKFKTMGAGDTFLRIQNLFIINFYNLVCVENDQLT